MTPSKSLPAPTMSVECPGCRERLEVRRADAGRKGQCTACGRVFRIGAAPPPGVVERVAVPAPPRPAAAPEPPPIFTFACTLCDTRMTVRTADAGKRIACPDCGRKNVIPKPPPPKAPVVPAALSGEQLGVWGLDEYPATGDRPAAPPPRLHPVQCGLCQTLMYASDAQVGTKIQCPDCGSFTLATPRPPTKPAGPLPVPPGREYQLDPASAPTPRPKPIAASFRDAELRAAGRLAAERAVTGGKKPPVDEPPRERPKLPRAPLITGVFPMLLTGELIAHWLLLSLLAAAAVYSVVQVVGSPQGLAGGLVGIAFSIFGALLGGFGFTWFASLALAIIAESSEGHDRLYQSPSWLSFEWFGDVLYFVTASGACGVAAAAALAAGDALPTSAKAALILAAFLLTFPVALLSTLDVGSPWAVVSTRVWRSLTACAGPWLLFYAESTALAVVAAAAIWALPTVAAQAMLPATLIGVAAVLTYLRLLGRLAWWIGEQMPAEENDQREFSRYRTVIAPDGDDRPPPTFRG